MIETIQWTDAGVVMIDQTKLPREEVYVTCTTYQEVAEAIRSMVIRGAPAIGVAAAMGVALGMENAETPEEFLEICATLAGTRPTAVNLFWAIDRMKRLYAAIQHLPIEQIRARLAEEARQVRLEDIAINEAIGRNGAGLIPNSRTVLTHCNAGALATAGYGTALGVIRAAVAAGKQIDVFADETRSSCREPGLRFGNCNMTAFQRPSLPTTWPVIFCTPAGSAAWWLVLIGLRRTVMWLTKSGRTLSLFSPRRMTFRSMWLLRLRPST